MKPLLLALSLLIAMLTAAPTQADVDQVRELTRQLIDKSKAIKDASDDEAVQRFARGIENVGYAARTLGVGLDALIQAAGQAEPRRRPEPADPDLEPIHPDAAATITPGDGWTGPTDVPAQIGSATEPAIAHWNVVPEQTISDGFTVGVIAHHLDGIDRVEIAANGGQWVTINEPSISPRTTCEEYWATIRSPGNEPIELRAIVYPKQGQPVLVTPMGSSYSKQGLTLYPYEVGEVLELDAGEHTLNPRSLPETGWLTVRPKPGVARDDVVLVGKSRHWGSGRLKLQDLTIKLPGGGGGIQGKANETDGSQVGNHVWLDNCRVIGNGPVNPTWATAFAWETASYTRCELSDINKVFFGHRGIDTLVRNCYIHDIYEDVFNSGGLHVNIVIEDIDRQPMIDAGHNKPHPDIWQLKYFGNTICQDITATKNINAQGVFPGKVDGVAMVRIKVRTVHPWRAVQPTGEISNWLIENSVIDGGSAMRGTLVGRMVQRGNVDGQGRPWRLKGQRQR